MTDEPRRTLVDGKQIYPEHSNIKADGSGMQNDYVVLAEEERAKGYVRPLRLSYRHLRCGAVTQMHREIAQTYARDPFFYSGTYCCSCLTHYPVGENGEFVWDGTDIKVGT